MGLLSSVSVWLGSCPLVPLSTLFSDYLACMSRHKVIRIALVDNIKKSRMDEAGKKPACALFYSIAVAESLFEFLRSVSHNGESIMLDYSRITTREQLRSVLGFPRETFSGFAACVGSRFLSFAGFFQGSKKVVWVFSLLGWQVVMVGAQWLISSSKKPI